MSFHHGSIVLGAGEGKTISVLGDAYTYKAAKEDTGGAYALIEGTVVGDGLPRTSTPRRKRPSTCWRGNSPSSSGSAPSRRRLGRLSSSPAAQSTPSRKPGRPQPNS